MPTAPLGTKERIDQAYEEAWDHEKWLTEQGLTTAGEPNQRVRKLAWKLYIFPVLSGTEEYAGQYRVFNNDRLRKRAADKYAEDPKRAEKAQDRERLRLERALAAQEDLAHKKWIRSAKSYLRALDEPERLAAAKEKSKAARKRRYRRLRAENLDVCEAVPDRRANLTLWATKSGVFRVKMEARRLTIETGVEHHADHIYPINSPHVCGLHCEQNLRAIPASINMEKSNSMPGCCADELWEPFHPDVYYDGELLSQLTRRRELEEAGKEAERIARERARKEIRRAREQERRASRPAKKLAGRRPMTAEKAIEKPAVRALLGGKSIREVLREFGGNGVKLVRYARLVNPDYQSPNAKHGRPQRT